jgi:D-alanyl-D-alanine carboxypeptidase/D-alanyl-D-alanine-endopeptidase (penicillin-binding protein 4)
MMRPTLLRWISLLCALLVAASYAAAAEARSPLGQRLSAALAGSGAFGRGTGAIAVELETGRVVYAHNAWASLVPASNQKLALTYAALVALGPSFRMRTEVLGVGYLDGRVWRGNLILKGFGDPTLTHWGLRALVGQLRHAGIRRVSGGIVADESYFDDRRTGPGWKASFYIHECDPLSALAAGRDEVTGKQALEAAQLFRHELKRGRIRVAGGTKVVRAGGFPLAVHWSPPLTEILRFMDFESDNYTAELVLKQLGATVAGEGTTAAGAAVVRAVLKERKIPLRGVVVADGSGLSALDRLTPMAVVTILQSAWADEDLRAVFRDLLPRAGREGTLRHRMRETRARGVVRAKTGTLNDVSALSGFVRDRYAFAILQNGSSLSSWAARKAQDRFASLLAAQ